MTYAIFYARQKSVGGCKHLYDLAGRDSFAGVKRTVGI